MGSLSFFSMFRQISYFGNGHDEKGTIYHPYESLLFVCSSKDKQKTGHFYLEFIVHKPNLLHSKSDFPGTITRQLEDSLVSQSTGC